MIGYIDVFYNSNIVYEIVIIPVIYVIVKITIQISVIDKL